MNILGNVVVAVKEPHRSISGPLTESGDTTEYRFKLTNIEWGGGDVVEVGCSLDEMKHSLLAPFPCGPLFWPKSNARGCSPPTPPLDTPMNFLKVRTLANLDYEHFIEVKKQMIRPNMKWGLLPAKMFAFFS